jgi:hypothetical protein
MRPISSSCLTLTRTCLPLNPGDLADAIALPCARGPIRRTSTWRRSRPSGSYLSRVHRHLSTIGCFSLCAHLWSLFLIRGSRHEVPAHSASVGGDLHNTIHDTRNRRTGAPFRVRIMCASRGHRADSGLRPRTHSCDRAVAPGARPLAPETQRGRHPLALTSTWRRSRPSASCATSATRLIRPHCAALRFCGSAPTRA